jgi:hypothetical protein
VSYRKFDLPMRCLDDAYGLENVRLNHPRVGQGSAIMQALKWLPSGSPSGSNPPKAGDWFSVPIYDGMDSVRHDVWHVVEVRADYDGMWEPVGELTLLSDAPFFSDAYPFVCVKAGSRRGDTVLDPFCGSGSSGVASRGLGRRFVGIDLLASYARGARERIGTLAGTASLPSTF